MGQDLKMCRHHVIGKPRAEIPVQQVRSAETRFISGDIGDEAPVRFWIFDFGFWIVGILNYWRCRFLGSRIRNFDVLHNDGDIVDGGVLFENGFNLL